MKLTKGMIYYFATWIVCIPAILALNVLLQGTIENFLTLIGAVALLQLMLMTLRLLFLKLIHRESKAKAKPIRQIEFVKTEIVEPKTEKVEDKVVEIKEGDKPITVEDFKDMIGEVA